MLVVLSLTCGSSLAGLAIPNATADSNQPTRYETKLTEPTVATKNPANKGKVIQTSTLPKSPL
jgi:hypothetical protein